MLHVSIYLRAVAMMSSVIVVCNRATASERKVKNSHKQLLSFVEPVFD